MGRFLLAHKHRFSANVPAFQARVRPTQSGGFLRAEMTKEIELQKGKLHWLMTKIICGSMLAVDGTPIKIRFLASGMQPEE